MTRLFNLPRRAQSLIQFAAALLLAALCVAPAVAVGPYDLKPLPERKLVRLSKDARTHYDLAWACIDKINYPASLKEFQLSVATDPDNIYLRELTAKMAIYLGGISSQKESQDFYDIAIENLTAISKSEQINRNQKLKVDATLKLTTDLREAVFRRDEMRVIQGQTYAKEVAEARAASEKRLAAKQTGAVTDGQAAPDNQTINGQNRGGGGVIRNEGGAVQSNATGGSLRTGGSR